MATPTLRALRHRFPTPTRIIGVMRPYVAQVLAGTPWLNDQLLWDRRSNKPELRSKALIPALQALRPNMAITLTNSFHSAWAAWRSGAGERIGYSRNLRAFLLNNRPAAPRNGWRFRPWSAVDQYLTLAQAAGCDVSNRQLQLATLPVDESGAERAWRELGLAGQRVVAVNIGSATSPARVWPQESVEQLCRELVTDSTTSVLLLCGPKERADVAAIEQRVGHPRVVSMVDQDLSLGVSKSVIRRSDALVTTDSGPRHIAAAFMIPTVTMFGPTDPAWSVNYSPVERWLYRDLPCRPCNKKQCPLVHHACLRELSVSQVLDALLALPSPAPLTNARAG